MPLELATITFNHDATSAATSALNIRRRQDVETSLPEYDAASPPATAADSPAAYAMAETAGQAVAVLVRCRATPPSAAAYEVKADGGGVLGALGPVMVPFPAGVTEVEVVVPLAARNFSAVGRHDVTWRWFSREPEGGGAWQSLATTTHRIYLVLAIPQAPWTQAFASPRTPWTDLLDVCCATAAGSRDAEAVTRAIARSVYADYGLRYDTGGGAARYGYTRTGEEFDLAAWIDYVLNGGAPAAALFCQGSSQAYRKHWVVGCFDCAAAVALMAKALGVAIEFQRHLLFGYLHYVEPIGRTKCNNPFGPCTGHVLAVGKDDKRTHFGTHAYVNVGGQAVYDACIKQWLSRTERRRAHQAERTARRAGANATTLARLRDQADGFLLHLTQAAYEKAVIDTSQSFEASEAGGLSPNTETLSFSVT